MPSFKRLLLDWFCPGGDGRDLFERAFDLRYASSDRPPIRSRAGWWFDRAALVGCTLLWPWWQLARRGLRRPRAGGSFAYVPPSYSCDSEKYYGFFLRHRLGLDAAFVGAATPFPIVPFPDLTGALRFHLRALLVAAAGFLDPSPVPYRHLALVFADLLGFVAARRRIRRVHVFSVAYLRPYLVATYLAEVLGLQVAVVFSNMSMYQTLRFAHLRCPAVLTSPNQVEEFDYFRRRGMIRHAAAVYAGSDYAYEYANLRPRPPRLFLGLFFSGEWARAGGGNFISRDLGAVRRMAFAGNVFYRTQLEVLEFLAPYLRRHGLRARIYPHPYERELLLRHGVRPPHLDRFVDGTTFDVDLTPVNSRFRIHEPLVAFSVQSSLIWERVGLGLPRSYLWRFEEQALNAFLPESLGPYRANLVGSLEELRSRLDEAREAWDDLRVRGEADAA